MHPVHNGFEVSLRQSVISKYIVEVYASKNTYKIPSNVSILGLVPDMNRLILNMLGGTLSPTLASSLVDVQIPLCCCANILGPNMKSLSCSIIGALTI